MLDPMFSFVDPFVEPVVELSEDNNCFVIPVEILLDFMKKAGIAKKAASVPEGAKVIEGDRIEVPIDIMMSLLRPDELEKLKNYALAYRKKYMNEEGEMCR